MKNLFLVFISLSLCSNISIVQEQAKALSELELITQTLTDYIEGSTNGQPQRLKTAFHPDLNLYYIKDDKVKTWSGVAYIEDTKEGEPTGENGTIISIDYENDAAIAKVEIAHPKSSNPYIDYFMLLKTEGTWTIIHKMFTKKALDFKSWTTKETSDHELITQSLMDYLEGTADGQPERIKRAFHTDLNLYTVENNSLKTRSGQKYITYFKEGEKKNRIGRIVSIDYENNAASAKIEILMPDSKRLYTDYLLLLKEEGHWKIIHKSYTYRGYSN